MPRCAGDGSEGAGAEDGVVGEFSRAFGGVGDEKECGAETLGQMGERIEDEAGGGFVGCADGAEQGADGVEDDEFAVGEVFQGVFDGLVVLQGEVHFEAVEAPGIFAVVEEVDFGEVGAVSAEAREKSLGGIFFAGDEEDRAERARGAVREWGGGGDAGGEVGGEEGFS